jgi:glutathione S-transferase
MHPGNDKAPSTIKLFGFGSHFGLPEVGYFVTKTEVQLQMAGLTYEKLVGHPKASPKGTLPYVEIDGVLLADSTFIRWYLERNRGVDLDSNLNTSERAIAWAVERMLEDHLRWAMVPIRTFDPENFARGYALIFEAMQEPERSAARAMMVQKTRERFASMGMGRHDEEEIVALGSQSIRALAILLGEKKFLFGDGPTGTDATAFGLLAGLITPYFPAPLRDVAMGHANIVDYVDRMMERFYPDYSVTS